MDKFRWYVYQLIDPRTGEPFYVGKGSGRRMWAHEDEARRGKHSSKTHRIWDIWNAGADVVKVQLAFFCDEQTAYDFETQAIDEIGLNNLTNVLPGGQKAWERRKDELRRRVSVRSQRATLNDWRKFLGHIAWVAHQSCGFKKWIKVTHCGDGSEMRNMILDMIDKRYGNIVVFMQAMMGRFIDSVGIDVAEREMLPYGVHFSKVGGVDHGAAA